MDRLQLPAAIALLVSAFLSLALLLKNKNEGKLQLPIHADGDDRPLEHDPFDVTKPEDVVDGYPIDEEGFWNGVCG
jgi:hypothetical protein